MNTNRDAVRTKRPDDLITPEEAAQLLGITAPTVRRMANRGELPPVRLGYRTLRFSRAAVLDLIAQRAGGTGEETGGEAADLHRATVRALQRAQEYIARNAPNEELQVEITAAIDALKADQGNL